MASCLSSSTYATSYECRTMWAKQDIRGQPLGGSHNGRTGHLSGVLRARWQQFSMGCQTAVIGHLWDTNAWGNMKDLIVSATCSAIICYSNERQWLTNGGRRTKSTDYANVPSEDQVPRRKCSMYLTGNEMGHKWATQKVNTMQLIECQHTIVRAKWPISSARRQITGAPSSEVK